MVAFIPDVISEFHLCGIGADTGGSKAYHVFDNMGDAHCERDDRVFTENWLLRFIKLGLG